VRQAGGGGGCAGGVAGMTMAVPSKGARPLGAMVARLWWVQWRMKEPLDPSGSSGDGRIPLVLKETAAAVLPSQVDGKTDSALLKETSAGDLITSNPPASSKWGKGGHCYGFSTSQKHRCILRFPFAHLYF
jgi:hypothetical protein